MRNGTKVGNAYVAITADGSSIPDNLSDGFKKFDAKKAGDDIGKKMSKNIAKHIKDVDKTFQQAFKDLDKAVAGDSAIGDGVARTVAKAFDDGRFKKVIERIGRETGADLINGFDREVSVSLLNSVEKAVLKASRSGKVDISKILFTTSSTDGQDFTLLGPAFDEALADVERKVQAHAKARLMVEKDLNKDLHKAEMERIRATVKNAKDLGKEIAEVEAAIDRATRDRWRQRNAALKAQIQYERMVRRGEINQRTGELIERESGTSLGDRVGNTLGRGSRFTTLHVIGQTAATATKAVTGLISLGTKLTSAFADGSAGKAGLGGFLGGIAGSIKVITPALPVMLGAATAAAGLVSVIGALGGVVAGLASTVASGLVGALTAAAGAMGVLAVNVGLVTLAFASMTDAQKDYLKDTFDPILDGLVGAGQILLDDFVPAFSTWAENLQPAVVLLGQLADIMGPSLAGGITILTEALSGPGFQRFIEMASVYLPNITTAFSQAAGALANGLAGMFAALLPSIERVAGYFAQLFTRFSEWTNSAEGQNAIVDFADRALDSLSSLWGFISQFSGLIKDVLFSPEAQEFGNTMFDRLAESFENLRDKVTSENLTAWFEQAAEIGSALWGVITSIGDVLVSIYNAGVIDALAASFDGVSGTVSAVADALGPVVDLLGPALAASAAIAYTAIEGVVASAKTLYEGFKAILDLVPGVDTGASWDNVTQAWSGVGDPMADWVKKYASGTEAIDKETKKRQKSIFDGFKIPDINWRDLFGRGDDARERTGVEPAKYVNPYTAWANSLVVEPSAKQELRDKVTAMSKDARKIVREAMNSKDGSATKDSLAGQRDAFRDLGKDLVSGAQQQLNSAATSLANATTPEAVAKALANVQKAQKGLAAAQKEQRRLNAAGKILAQQAKTSDRNVKQLVNGVSVTSATLTDYARAQERVAKKLEAAKEKLAEAVDLRDTYNKSITDAAKAFGALTTAQAKVVDGVEQALTAKDITDNLQDRLNRIRKFTADLRMLASLGLSDSAYKQIADMGVEAGSAYAQALIEGGPGAIGQTNTLVAQIDAASAALGKDASSKLYQAGVDAARGLVEGLESLSSRLDAAADRLGKSIATALKRALGIKSPSRVMKAAMGDVGDGLVEGMDDQHYIVSQAATRLSKAITVQPEVQGPVVGSPFVDGNSDTATPIAPSIINMDIHGFTNDPKVAAQELLNEMTGRLT